MELYDRIEKYLTEKLYPFWYSARGRARGRLHDVFRQEREAYRPDGQDDHPADPVHLHALPRHQKRLRRGQGAGRSWSRACSGS